MHYLRRELMRVRQSNFVSSVSHVVRFPLMKRMKTLTLTIGTAYSNENYFEYYVKSSINHVCVPLHALF